MSFQEHIASRLSVEYLIDQIQYGLLRDIVEECFLQEGFTGTIQEKAEAILRDLFGLLVRGFDFRVFLADVPEGEREAFLRDILYHIYYRNFQLEHLVSPERLVFYLFRTLALTASGDTLRAIYHKLPNKRTCLAFCIRNFDEGAYRILQCEKNCEALSLYERKLISDEEVVAWLEEDREYDYEERIQSVAAHFSLPIEPVTRFCSIFGLYDHQVPKQEWDLHEHAGLDEKLAHAAKGSEFCKAVQNHIEALGTDKYVEGAKLITYALPTMGKDLRLYAYLPSLIRSIEGFCQEFGIPNSIPIFVFDQSEEKLFEKNAAFCKSLSKNIVHLGSDFILSLAKRLKIEKLVQTGAKGEFGYGGARNAVFLLAPLLNYYRMTGQALDSQTIEQDFQDIVLHEKKGPTIIHMGDDDVHVPYSTVFSDALFAWEHRDEYFFRFSWIKGRRTTYTETTFNLDYMLERSSDILLQHSWQDVPFRHGMAGLLTKPKLCLNVPLGQEEAYLIAMQEYSFDLRQPFLHLSGYRLPQAGIPTNRLSGLSEYLRTHYRYIIGLMLITDLLDPLNVFNRSAIPWNMVKKPFSSLQDAIDYITKQEVIEEMQSLFKTNMANLQKGLQNYSERAHEESNLALFHLSLLEVQEVDTILAKYARFPKEVDELKALFCDLKVDYKAFQNALAGCEAVPERSIITSSFLLLKDNILNAAFQRALPKRT